MLGMREPVVFNLPVVSTRSSLRRPSVGLCVTALLLGTACLEKQPDSEITISGTYGGVGGGEGSLGGTGKVGDLSAMPKGSAASDAPPPEHQLIEHVDMPAGAGSAEMPAPEGAPAAADGAPAAALEGATGEAPVGVPEAVPHSEMTHVDHQHVDRPPGFGQDAAVAPAPVGSPGGSMEGGLPQIASPFERQYADKPMVTVRGKLVMEAEGSGVADIDCFVPDETSPAKRKFVNKIKAIAPGNFEMKVPASYGPLILSAFLDLDSDGPDPQDPQGSPEDGTLQIGTEDLSDIIITLGAAKAPPPAN